MLPRLSAVTVDLDCSFSLCMQFSEGVGICPTHTVADTQMHRYEGKRDFGIPKILLLSLQNKKQVSSLILLSLHR